MVGLSAKSQCIPCLDSKLSPERRWAYRHSSPINSWALSRTLASLPSKPVSTF